MQLVALLQETPLSEFPSDPGFGLAPIVHTVPFQDSMSVALPSVEPTATQLVDVLHDTPWRKPVLGPAPATSVHVVPFQDSVNVSSATWLKDLPTAIQLFGVAQDTPKSPALSTGFGLSVTAQLVPSQISTSVVSVEFAAPRMPTATHDCALAHETPKRRSVVSPGSGLAATDQSVPFQDSIKGWLMVPGPLS